MYLLYIFIFNLFAFFLLTPNILFLFDSNKSNYIVVFLHALLFGVISTIVFKYYGVSLLYQCEGADNANTDKMTCVKQCKKR